MYSRLIGSTKADFKRNESKFLILIVLNMWIKWFISCAIDFMEKIIITITKRILQIIIRWHISRTLFDIYNFSSTRHVGALYFSAEKENVFKTKLQDFVGEHVYLCGYPWNKLQGFSQHLLFPFQEPLLHLLFGWSPPLPLEFSWGSNVKAPS